MVEKEVDTSALTLSHEEIFRTMGVPEGAVDELSISLVEEVLPELMKTAKPRYAYMYVDSVDFKYGRIIREGLKNAERYAVVVSTVGPEADALLHHYQEVDMIKAFTGDAIATEMAEAVQRVALEAVESEMLEGERISNPYSPGYCGWMLKEQTKLFGLFEKAPCDVELTDSCLLLPIKSISSVLAIGQKVVKAPYGCAVCGKMDCYKKRKNDLHKKI